MGKVIKAILWEMIAVKFQVPNAIKRLNIMCN